MCTKSLTPEENKFKAWYKKAVEQGLKDIKFVFCQRPLRENSENFFAEVNSAINTPSVPRGEVF